MSTAPVPGMAHWKTVEMMEEETIIKGYDPLIMRRLLAYAKPYWYLVVGALVSLGIATAADLLLPVVIQRAVDEQLLVRYTRIPNAELDNDALANVSQEDAITLTQATYIQDQRMVAVSGVARDRLNEAGLLEETAYYVFPLTESLTAEFGKELRRVLTETGSVGAVTYASIPIPVLNELPQQIRAQIRAHDLDQLKKTAQTFLLLLAGVLVFTFAQVYLTAWTGQGVMKDLRMQLFHHTMRQRLAYLSGHPVGRIVTRVTNDIETVNQLFTEALVQLLKNVALMFGSVVTIMLLNWRLGLVTLATLPPVLVATVIFRRYARDAYRRVRLAVSRLNAFLSEHLSGMQIVQLFVKEEPTRTAFGERNNAAMHASLGEMYVFATFRPIIDLLSSTSIAVVVYFGGRFLLSGVVSLGVLIAFVNLVRRFYRPVMQISEQFTLLQSAMAGGERVFQMLDTTERIPDNGNAGVSGADAGALEFKNVWFAYKEGEPVIKDLSFSVTPGETIAVVGYTGAGKTTIANLLTRLWDIQDGSILLNGRDVREYPLETLRTTIAPIQQDVFLFNDTVRNNIALGLRLDDQRIWEVLTMVQADGFVARLSGGLDTVLTEGASNISTGERQLLSFARILAHDPHILIMDEATSNIDTETEQRIQRAIETLMNGRTALVIAHRLSTIKNADRILVLSEGRLVEEGSHDQLIRQEGIYYNLYRLQYQGSA